ncbi:WYL domain-containing protein [Sphingopyxis macrogoltabida]|uniref:Transcriptional regulator n=1 Tax=Sphingopyxis macrogoltabida TaxID=33050 RepID=A0AAC9AUF3_SPHMC|nr:WYL domain-containing protein [Sphingopyxis macrogoltabida]ALJ12286.1 transcriptional regulator [Sphingopyxis macrogoltabida]AMU88456.1 transcriptional regulator [Sphingopyxis macrogoltabida]
MDRELGLRRGVESRLEFIEFRLFWEGHVNRSDLVEVFGVSINQASTDLNRYLGLAEANMVYDKSARTYVRSSSFSPVFLKPDAGQYLAQLRSLSDGVIAADDGWIGSLPSFACAPTPARGVSPKILRATVTAIKRHEAIEVFYQSMSSPEPAWRWIEPHALVFDGFRWHARAHCPRSGAFKDFVLSRIAETRASKSTEAAGSADREWEEQVELKIAPHPELSAGQRKAIELDYGMEAGVTTITVRRALLYYALKRLGLDTDPAARRPQDQQIVLLNAAEIRSGERAGGTSEAEGAQYA